MDYLDESACAGQDTGLSAVDAWAVAEDRPTWRALLVTHSRLRTAVSE